MNFGLISGALIVFVVGIFAYKLLFKRDKKTNYISALGKIVLFVIIIVGVGVIWIFFTRTQIYRNSIGSLYTDYADSKSSDKGSDSSDDVLTITISLDSIKIEDSIYDNVLDVQQIIADAVNSGKQLRVIDDYALAKTYNDLIDVILKMKVSRSNIEEIQQP